MVAVDSFLICFRQFYFLTQSDDFARAIAFAWRPFLPYSNCVIFQILKVFLERFFA